MVNIKPGLLPKIQAQSKKFSYHISHARIVETKIRYTIKNAGVKVIQLIQVKAVMTMGVLSKSDCYYDGCVEYNSDGDMVGFR